MAIEGFAASVSGLLADTTGLNGISRNIANMGTDGYKRVATEFRSYLNPALGYESRRAGGVAADQHHTAAQLGGVRTTGESFDLALGPRGFFSVADPDRPNRLLYTRNGHFTPRLLDIGGEGHRVLATEDGFPLLGWYSSIAGTYDAAAAPAPLRLEIEEEDSFLPSTEGGLWMNIPADSLHEGQSQQIRPTDRILVGRRQTEGIGDIRLPNYRIPAEADPPVRPAFTDIFRLADLTAKPSTPIPGNPDTGQPFTEEDLRADMENAATHFLTVPGLTEDGQENLVFPNPIMLSGRASPTLISFPVSTQTHQSGQGVEVIAYVDDAGQKRQMLMEVERQDDGTWQARYIDPAYIDVQNSRYSFLAQSFSDQVIGRLNQLESYFGTYGPPTWFVPQRQDTNIRIPFEYKNLLGHTVTGALRLQFHPTSFASPSARLDSLFSANPLAGYVLEDFDGSQSTGDWSLSYPGRNGLEETVAVLYDDTGTMTGFRNKEGEILGLGALAVNQEVNLDFSHVSFDPTGSRPVRHVDPLEWADANNIIQHGAVAFQQAEDGQWTMSYPTSQTVFVSVGAGGAISITAALNLPGTLNHRVPTLNYPALANTAPGSDPIHYFNIEYPYKDDSGADRTDLFFFAEQRDGADNYNGHWILYYNQRSVPVTFDQDGALETFRLPGAQPPVGYLFGTITGGVGDLATIQQDVTWFRFGTASYGFDVGDQITTLDVDKDSWINESLTQDIHYIDQNGVFQGVHLVFDRLSEIERIDGKIYNYWEMTYPSPDGPTTARLQFDSAGRLVTPRTVTIQGGMILDLTHITMQGNVKDFQTYAQNGIERGELLSCYLNDKGQVIGHFTNDQDRPIGQIALSRFANTRGLEETDGIRYLETENSGPPVVFDPSLTRDDLMAVESVEASNVDMNGELTDMIRIQRAYDMNSRSFQIADELLQTLKDL